MSPSPPPSPAAGDAPHSVRRLLAAALVEFEEHGFHGTDSNKIARRAGFAPQTFYRRFRDKTDIFLAAYRAWQDEERSALASLAAGRASALRMAQTLVEHHRRHRGFRRSLRQLACTDPQVRAARAQSRIGQLEGLRAWSSRPAGERARMAAKLLQLERLADALAEGEFADLGIGERAALNAIAALIGELRGR